MLDIVCDFGVRLLWFHSSVMQFIKRMKEIQYNAKSQEITNH